ncbi:MAG: hypothetical protein V3T71_02030 [Dehalococcoidia bacterium]
MTKSARGWGLAVSILAVAAIVAGCSSSASTQEERGVSPTSPQSIGATIKEPTNGSVQSNSGGSVTIDVEWEEERGGFLTFKVSMNTHSVNLDRYDLGELAVLRDEGGAEYRPASWTSASGGHHRKGVLTFSLPDSLSQGNARYVEMIIRDVAGVEERLLKWVLE